MCGDNSWSEIYIGLFNSPIIIRPCLFESTERALSEELNSTSVDDQGIGEGEGGGPVVTKSGKRL